MEQIIETEDPRVVIEIDQDEDPRDRTWQDNLATLLCAHRRYELGDEQLGSDHDSIFDALCHWVYNDNREAREFQVQYYEGLMLRDMIEAIMDGEIDPDCDLEKENWEDGWRYDNGYPEDDHHQWGIEKWLELNAVVSPLYLYDHSGITISTRPFSCRWDSGQVGYAIIYKSTIEEHWGSCEDWQDKGQEIIDWEVKGYDDCLTGNVWSFAIMVNGEIVDSCSGFIGDVEECGVIEEAKSSAKHEIARLAEEDAEVEYWKARDVVTK